MKVLHGNCLDLLRELPDNHVDSIVTDPPYGLSFMGKHWDYDVPAVEIWAECLRVLKPGGHLLSFAGTRTQHRMCVNIEDAGFEIRDMIAWVYGSGFPKSLDVSKAIDKERKEDVEPVRVICRIIRAAMDARGYKSRHLVKHFDGCHPRLVDHWAARDTDSQPSLPTWEQWLRLKTVLCIQDTHDEEVWRLNGRKGKPGDNYEKREVIGAKTTNLTPYQNIGGKNESGKISVTAPATEAAKQWQGWGTALKPALEPITVARKPLIGTVAENVQTHGTGAINVDGCRVGSEERTYAPRGTSANASMIRVPEYRAGLSDKAVTVQGRWPANLLHDGSEEVTELLDNAARFFYCAKASKKDRGEGNKHPTVKPTDLMRYLCRLVTPPGGTVLDPFMGSGSTGKAAVLEGFKFIGIEREAEYVEIARKRIESAKEKVNTLLI